MREETLFEKFGVKYIEKDGIFYPLITSGGEENSTYRRNIRSDTEV